MIALCTCLKLSNGEFMKVFPSWFRQGTYTHTRIFVVAWTWSAGNSPFCGIFSAMIGERDLAREQGVFDRWVFIDRVLVIHSGSCVILSLPCRFCCVWNLVLLRCAQCHMFRNVIRQSTTRVTTLFSLLPSCLLVCLCSAWVFADRVLVIHCGFRVLCPFFLYRVVFVVCETSCYCDMLSATCFVMWYDSLW